MLVDFALKTRGGVTQTLGILQPYVAQTKQSMVPNLAAAGPKSIEQQAADNRQCMAGCGLLRMQLLSLITPTALSASCLSQEKAYDRLTAF